jgi:retinol-binding protein 3
MVAFMSNNKCIKTFVTLFFISLALMGRTQQQPEKFSSAERNQVIDTLVERINRIYVYDSVAKKMTDFLRLRQRQHAYDIISDRSIFAQLLTTDLQAISKDHHLGIESSRTPVINQTPGAPSPGDVASFRAKWAQYNFNIKKVEHLDGNIGLLQLDSFFPAEWIKEIVAGAFSFLANTDAIIIDLRNNHGFAPDGVNLIESYFFDESTHIADQFDRDAKTLHQFWTMPVVSGPKFTKEIYILVSKNTFSAPESFSFEMQAIGRAQVIGEVTGGGAHGTKPFMIGRYFIASIPFSYEQSPVTHTDWEGKGVQPNVKVSADQALLKAHELAIRSAINLHSTEIEYVKNLNQILTSLQNQQEKK